VKKVICFSVLAWIFSQTSSQAQSGPDAGRLLANSEIPSSLVAAFPSQPRTGGEPYRSTSNSNSCVTQATGRGSATNRSRY